jgi:hypothetical protein
MSTDSESLEEVYRSYYRQGATDGLPVVPPTDERVAEMLRGTDANPDRVLGHLGEAERPLTVEKLAAMGVMAGCLPVHMPVLEAGARALADPAANAIQSSTSTGSWAYCWLVNGPIRRELDINGDTGAFGQGWRSNQTVGRALGLAYKTTAEIHPSEKDMGTQGNPFKFNLIAGENEERSPWDPYHVTKGYDRETSTITLSTPQSFVQHVPTEMTAQGVLKGMINNSPPAVFGVKTETWEFNAVYTICPFNAEELADLTRQEIKEYIYENAYKDAGAFGFETFIEEDAEVQPLQVRKFDSPERIKLFVTGGAGRLNGIFGPTVGKTTTKEIRVPDGWERLLEEYRLHLEREWGKDRPGERDLAQSPGE